MCSFLSNVFCSGSETIFKDVNLKAFQKTEKRISYKNGFNHLQDVKCVYQTFFHPYGNLNVVDVLINTSKTF